MTSGIPILTEKGRAALSTPAVELTARSRSILVQVDGKRSLDGIRSLFKGLEGLDASMDALLTGGYMTLAQDCTSVVKEIASRLLGVKAGTILRKIDDMHARYGDACWDHLDELDKAARLFYGEKIATSFRSEIESALRQFRK